MKHSTKRIFSESELVTIYDASETVLTSLGITQEHAFRIMILEAFRGSLPHITDGNQVWFKRLDLQVWLDEKKVLRK